MADDDPSPKNIDSQDLPAVLEGGWPDRLRNSFARNLEPIFVILIGGLVMAVFYLFPHNRTAFLNFFYLPVLAAAYFLGKRKAVLGARSRAQWSMAAAFRLRPRGHSRSTSIRSPSWAEGGSYTRLISMLMLLSPPAAPAPCAASPVPSPPPPPPSRPAAGAPA